MKEQRKERPFEQEAVNTTIVGGRPPGAGKPVGNIPRGIEVLVKKASIDSAFKTLLLEKRADAAKEIELALEPSEVMMLNTVPREQLESIIAKTTIRPSQRAAFMGKVAALMIVALTATIGCKEESTRGIQPDKPEYNQNQQRELLTEGHAPDRPDETRIDPEKEKILREEFAEYRRRILAEQKKKEEELKIMPPTAGIRPDSF
jgi:hypothetical protein